MRVMLTGCNGQVGWELRRTLSAFGEVAAFDRSGLELTDRARLRSVIRQLEPRLIVNAAAYTDVDLAESNEALAMRVNAEAVRVMAEEADRLDSWMVHFSSDYVFDGAKQAPYVEDDEPNPVNAYGRTKLAGERAIAAAAERHLIFRTSWVYADRGKNLLVTIRRLAEERDQLQLVDDQRGAPTWARSIAEATALSVVQVLYGGGGGARSKAGVYHLTCGGAASWYDFACEILRLKPSVRLPIVTPIETSQYPTQVRRPLNSVLSNQRFFAAFGLALPDWRDALAMCLDD